jgi:hypothetical protein
MTAARDHAGSLLLDRISASAGYEEVGRSVLARDLVALPQDGEVHVIGKALVAEHAVRIAKAGCAAGHHLDEVACGYP